jgi:hypothetical protein
MNAIRVELPDTLAAEINGYLNTGWFDFEGEVVLAALMDFVTRDRIDRLERASCVMTSIGRSRSKALLREGRRLRYLANPTGRSVLRALIWRANSISRTSGVRFSDSAVEQERFSGSRSKPPAGRQPAYPTCCRTQDRSRPPGPLRGGADPRNVCG